ncbi:uncharacterized protein KGF55_004591 [Candida pseudojiufengensis]|uniref:uncharacterized protein n=1 Tax=Candida pseudojiufengensis TaxID=497109 RepID=UPI002224A287|nr:uncharacterized protein KGF55_004591 [Candida pseudojiufengensis]KAI5960299.1 hypothetical protein KGF55_004591 [Candida pseudojiufengensis]
MSEQGIIEVPHLKYPNPLANFSRGIGYPQWKPIDTKKQVFELFKFGFYSTVGSYAFLYMWKRTTFKLTIPISAITFITVAKGIQSSLANLREKNDCWNIFWGLIGSNTLILSLGFKNMPPRTKIITGFLGTTAATIIDRAYWAQSASSPVKNAKYDLNQSNEKLTKQQFWDVWNRRPATETFQDLNVLSTARVIEEEK